MPTETTNFNYTTDFFINGKKSKTILKRIKIILKMTKWISKEVDLSAGIKKAKNNNKILYPVFEECSNLIDDKLWVDLFSNCAKGKFPKGFTYSFGYLKYRKGQKMLQIEVPESSDLALVSVKKFISENGSIFSESDKKLQDNHNENFSIEKPNLITKKDKYSFSEYIDDYISEKDFSHQEALKYIINFGFEYSLLNDKDVVYKDNKIVKIENILFSEEFQEYYIPEERLKIAISKKKNNSRTTKKTLESEIWGKYLKKLFKNSDAEEELDT